MSGSNQASMHVTGVDRERIAMPARFARYEGIIKIIAILALLLGLFLIARTVPVEAGLTRLEMWIDGLGAWGPLVYGGIYVIAAVLFVPGAALTIVAGAIFGLAWGLVTVSLASAIAAAFAFLIARYLARNIVREQTRKHPKFYAIDRAIGEGDWRVVALLRLVPLFPYSMGNYLLGLTAVRFWPYVLATWVAMLPATFVLVYFGHLGRIGLEAAGTGAARSPLEWTLLIIGIAAAIGVVVYLTRLAQRALREQIGIDPESDDSESSDKPGAKRASRIGTLVLAAVAALTLALGVFAQFKPDWLTRHFYPAAVTMTEAYERKPDGPVFDHSTFDRLLQTHVEDGGWVDYTALKADDRDTLQAYIEQLAEADFEALGRDEKLALLINAYNAFTLELILEYWHEDDSGTLQSIKDIPEEKRWDDERWRVGENVWSLNQIEHEQIRPKFKEPRIHWAVVCAAIGCPPLRQEAYVGERIEAQLDDQGRIVHNDERWFRYERDENVVYLTQLYEWYRGDYQQVDGGILEHAAQYVPQLKDDLEEGTRPRVRWLEYDWDLNHREHVR